MRIPSSAFVILTNLVQNHLPDSIQIIRELSDKYHIEHPMLSNSFQITNLTGFPKYHAFSKFHYEYIYKMMPTTLSYAEFCSKEEQISDIIKSYIYDTRKINHMVIFDSEEWLYDNSIISYFTNDERKQIERTMIVSLDESPKLSFLPHTEKKLFFWNLSNHPRI